MGKAKGDVFIETRERIYSFSALTTFEQCKYQYYLNYVMPRELRPPNEENAFSQYGGFVHELLEQCSLGKVASFELCEKYVDEFDIAVTMDFPPNAFADLRSSYYNDGYSFLEKYEGFPEYEILGVEQKFTEDFGSFKLRGVIDLILRDKEGNIIIQDWKSKAKFKNKEEQRHYGFQTHLYAKHIKSKYGVWPTTLRFYMFRKGNIVDIPFTVAGYEDAVQWAENTINQIRVCEEWVPSCDSFFGTTLCGFRNSCQYVERDVIAN